MDKKYGKFGKDDRRPGRDKTDDKGKRGGRFTEDKPARRSRPEGRPEAKPEGRPHGKPDGKTDERPARKSYGKPEGKPYRKPEGRPYRKSEDKPSEKPYSKTGRKPDSRSEDGRSAPARPRDDRKDSSRRPGKPEQFSRNRSNDRGERPTRQNAEFVKGRSIQHDFEGREHNSAEASGEDDRLILKGRHEVVQALESGQKIDSIVISTAVKGPVGGVVRELASKAQVPVKEMNPDLFARKFGDKSQGIVAIVGSFAYCSLEEIEEKASAGRGVLVALNHVEDARNLGAIVRTVEASGCSGVLIPKHRSAGMSEWAVRTAQGAASYLPVARVNNIGEAVEKLKEQGYWVVGLDGDALKRYDKVVYSGKIVLIAGGEDAGLGERVRKVCDDVVSIPLSGKTPSLNVSVSTAVVLYEILRQKQFFKK
ncbi:MAG: 23S rRNA (guanosine(2251)-2'-O)-methyltransferase RlmB [Candidatus Riflebacteria bacterium]|nr:23S rRNA (guanosine(2251)-2'-O)-methyltransferase RlmB [Candidatus Riflebacteria bacterium]